MIAFVTLLPVLGSAFRLLASGGKVDAGVWGSEVTNVLSALLAENNRTAEALAQIETKLDDISLQPFRHSFTAALTLMGEATPEWREPDVRDSLISEARNRLIDALATEPDPLSRATVEWYLGVAWLLSRSTRDCERAMARAADTCLSAMVEIVEVWRSAPASSEVKANARALEGGVDRLNTWLFGGAGSAQAKATATLQARRGLAPYAEELEAALRGIQGTRLTMGADPRDCPAARFGPKISAAAGAGPKVIVDLPEGHTARLGPIEVGVGAVQDRLASAGLKGSVVDAEVLLACPAAAAPVEFRLALLNDQQIRQWHWGIDAADKAPPYVATELFAGETQETMLLDGAFASERSLDLPGNGLMADGGHHPPRGRVRLNAGQARGWLRFVCIGTPAAIIVTPPAAGFLAEPIHFIRSL
jgi:hypothetical protein